MIELSLPSLGGPAGAALAVGLVLLALVLALLLLRREGCPGRAWRTLLPALVLALGLRLLCLDYRSHDYDTFLAQWVEFFRTNGGFAALREPVGDYNVPYLYFLAAFSYLPVPDLYLIKGLSVLCDVLLAWGGLRLVRRLCPSDSRAPWTCFALLLLLPTVVLNGAYWGQCDSLYGALVLLALSAALEGRPGTSVVLLSVAFSFKLQTVFLIPLWCVFWYTGRLRLRHLLWFPAGYFATIVPALLLGRPLGDILSIYLRQSASYSALTLNAPSVYSLLPYQMEMDEGLAAGAGIAAAFALVLALLAVLFLLRRRVTQRALLTAAVVLAVGVPFLLPHMHERYFFLADVLTLVWACTDRRRAGAAALVQGASLSCYSAYLSGRYTLVLVLLGHTFPMGGEALAELAVLVYSLAALRGQLREGEGHGRLVKNF